MRTLFFLVLAFSILPASIVELILDDNSFEAYTGYSFGIPWHGQMFTNLPSLYALMYAKVYFSNTNGQTQTIKIYNGVTWPNPVWLFTTSVPNPQTGWNTVSLQQFHLGSCPSSILVMITTTITNNIGIDTDDTLINNHRYHTESPSSWSIVDHAIGVRLVIDNNPISVNPTSLGSIKATFH